MKVTTLHQADFVARCRELEAKATGYAPDLIVGIANGGVHVAANMFAGVAHTQVLCQRSGTRAKQRAGFVFAVVRMLPEGVRNWLRVREARSLAKRKGVGRHVCTVAPGFDAAVQGAKRILVVDDAVDSGASMKAVLDAIEALASPGAEVRTAAIVVTTENPIVKTHYYIYKDGRLVRFPWSADMRSKK